MLKQFIRKAMGSRGLAMVLSICMVFTLFPTIAFAEEIHGPGGTVINSNTALQTALGGSGNATIEGDMVKLVQDVTLDSNLRITGTVKLDLNGHTLSFAGSTTGVGANYNALFFVSTSGNLTIKDSDSSGQGKVEHTRNSGSQSDSIIYCRYEDSQVTIENGIFPGKVIMVGGTITIKDGTFSDLILGSAPALKILAGTFSYISMSDTTLKMKDIVSDGSYMADSNGNEISGWKNSTEQYPKNVWIRSTADAEKQKPKISVDLPEETQYYKAGDDKTLSVTATVDDGTLTYQWYQNNLKNISGTLISGATSANYKVPTTAAGTIYYYVVVTNSKAGVSVTSKIATVTVSEAGHGPGGTAINNNTALQTALGGSNNATIESDTVKLAQDVMLNSNLRITGTVKLDLNGHTLSFAGSDTSYTEYNALFYVEAAGNLTIKDSDSSGQGKVEHVRHQGSMSDSIIFCRDETSQATIENGIYSGTVRTASGTITIKNGIFSGLTVDNGKGAKISAGVFESIDFMSNTTLRMPDVLAENTYVTKNDGQYLEDWNTSQYLRNVTIFPLGTGYTINYWLQEQIDKSSGSSGSPTEITIPVSGELISTISIPKGKYIKLTGSTLTRAIDFEFAPLFNVKGELILENITLDGNKDNNASGDGLLEVDGGKLTLNSGAVLQNNNGLNGGAVRVCYGGSVIMNDGKITGNEALTGGGVFAFHYIGESGGTFTMNGGEISGNTAQAGSGVYITSSSTFNLHDNGIIKDNAAPQNVSSGGFDGTISVEIRPTVSKTLTIPNTQTPLAATFGIEFPSSPDSWGGGVYNMGTFTMDGGEISGNTAGRGGAVYYDEGSCTITGGVISGNYNTYGGTGLYARKDFSIGGDANIADGIYLVEGKKALVTAALANDIQIEGIEGTPTAGTIVAVGSSHTISDDDFGKFSIKDTAWMLEKNVSSQIVLKAVTPDQTEVPTFDQAEKTMASAVATDIEFTISGTPAATYKLYSAGIGGDALEKPSVAVTGNTIKLTFDTAPTADSTFYVSATENGKTESTRTEIQVLAFVSPSVTLGSDKEVKVTFASGDGESDTKTDTIGITTKAGTDTSKTFNTGDFSVSSSSSAKNPITGVTVTAIGTTTPGTTALTVQVARSVTATTGYLWYGDKSVGQITINKIVEADPVTTISKAEVTGITEPKANETPDTTADNRTGWTAGTVTWNPNDNKFGYSTVYTASVTLTAASGYTFAETGNLNATVGGQTAIVSRTSDTSITVSYQFPETEAAGKTEHSVTYTLTNLTADGQPEKVEAGQKLEAILKAGAGYHLPDSVTVKMGDASLGTGDYTYDKSSGKVTVSSVTGNVEIIAAGVKDQEPEKSSNANLKALSYQVGSETKKTVADFDAATTDYSVELPSGTSKTTVIKLIGETDDVNATITLNAGVALADGEGTADITVTAENGTTKTYTVKFTVKSETGTFVAVNDITEVETTGTAGTDLTLGGTVTPDDATNQEIVWSLVSAGDTGASISGDVLSTTAAGTAKVKATITNGRSETVDFTKEFTVSIEAKTGDYKAVNDITGVKTTGTAGIDLTLGGTVKPSDAANQDIIWSVEDEGTTGASLSGDVLSTTAAGTVKVMATITNGKSEDEDFTKTFTITIKEPSSDFVAVETITGVPDSMTVGSTLQLKGTVKPSDATNQTITWEITEEGETGAALDADNKITADTAGEITVTATVADGVAEGEDYTQEFTVTVKESTTSDAVYVASASNAVRAGSYEVKQSTTEEHESFLSELVILINKIIERIFGAGNMENITSDDISDLEITIDPVAGDEDDHSGTDGEFSFNVEIHKGDESEIVEGLTGTIKATPYKDEEQEAKDQEIVDEAKDAIETSDYVIPQSKAKDESRLKNTLKSKAHGKAGKATVDEIQIVEAEYATAGTKEKPEGTEGYFTFKARIRKGSIQLWTEEIEGIITPNEYVLKKPVITIGSLPDGMVGTQYSETLTADSEETVTWAVTDGSLPDGFTLDEDGGLSGTPETAGQFTFTVSAENGSEQGAAEKTYTIKINPPSDKEEYTITATAGTGGSITPSGEVIVAAGGSQKFTITAANRYYTKEVFIDGVSVESQTSYTFSNVTGDHTIEAVFERGSVGPGGGGSSDGGGNSGGGNSDGGGNSGGGSFSSGSSASAPSTTTNTSAAEDGGSVTTTRTTSKDSSGKTTTVTTEVIKDASGNVTGSTTTVTTDNITTSMDQGNAIVMVKPDASAINSAAGAAGASAESPMDVMVTIPQGTIENELQKADVNAVHVNVVLPKSVDDNPAVQTTGVTIEKEAVEAARQSGKGLEVTVRKEAGTVEAVWFLNGQDMKIAAGQATDLNLGVHAAPVQSNDPAAVTVKPPVTAGGHENGLVLTITANGTLLSTTKLTVPATDQTGITAGATVTLYRFDQATGALNAVPGGVYTVDANGNVTIDVPAGTRTGAKESYVLLTDAGQAAQGTPAAGTGASTGTSTGASTGTSTGASTAHTIKRGDTLNKISQQYGCRVEELLALNLGVNIYDLRIGSNIAVPAR